jgi:hypothetical protein
MNAALRKEVRLLLPAWVAALVAATVPVWVLGPDFQTMKQMSFILFAAGALLLSLASFGLEMSLGTFPSLLAQPRPRLDIWQMKIGLLASALALVVVAACFSWWLRVHTILAGGTRAWYEISEFAYCMSYFWPVIVRYLLLLAVMAFAGGLWTTLVFRQTVAAFWFAILVPIVLYNVLGPLIERLLEEDDASFVMAGFGLAACGYAALGYGLARWLFLHAQDKQARVATDAVTWSLLPAFATRRWPVAALLVKELRLQQGMLLIAVVLLLLHLAALAASAYFPPWALKYFSLVWVVWLVAPLVVGCASIAEERRGLTLESALCLPVGRLRQFAIKLLVVFGLGIFLGAGMPWLLEQLRPVAGSDNPLITTLLMAAAMITAIGCYASSLSGALLQGFGAAIFLYLMSFAVAASFDSVRWAFIGFPWLSWTLLSATIAWLSYSNFKQLRITWRQWLRNGLILLAVVFGPHVIMSAINYWLHF